MDTEDFDQDEYDAQYDFENPEAEEEGREKLSNLQFAVESIDYTYADPDEIENEEVALQILKYLQDQELCTAEASYYRTLMSNFGIEEADPTELTRDEKLAVAGSFKMFVRYMFMVEYGKKFVQNWHHDILCDLMEDLYLGRAKSPRLIINIPPRYSKTQILIYLVAWTMGMKPESEFIMIAYAMALSEDSSSKIRDILLNEKYLEIFDVQLDKSSTAKTDFKTTKRGRVYATSTGGTLTGKGAGKMHREFGGMIIVDDGNNSSDTFSETNRNKANSWVQNTLMSRRNNMKYTPMLVVAQRLHENDISGFLLPSDDNPKGGVGEDFTHVNIPAILNKEQLAEFNVPLDSDTYKYGDPDKDEYPLWHFKIDLETLRSMRESLPVITFFGQYMQQPYALDGAIIKTEWFRRTKAPKPEEIKYTVFILDTAQTVKSRSDFSVILVAHVLHSGQVYLADLHRERLEAPALTEKVLELFGIYHPRKIYIEFKSSGIGLYQYLSTNEVPMPLEKISRNAAGGDGDSVTRASGVSTYLKCGYVQIPLEAHWVTTFLHEVMAFPTGAHDDQVDCLTDLVAKEVMQGGNYMPEMVVDELPLKGSTYAEEEVNESERLLDLMGIAQGLGVVVHQKTVSSEPEWASLLN